MEFGDIKVLAQLRVEKDGMMYRSLSNVETVTATDKELLSKGYTLSYKIALGVYAFEAFSSVIIRYKFVSPHYKTNITTTKSIENKLRTSSMTTTIKGGKVAIPTNTNFQS